MHANVLVVSPDIMDAMHRGEPVAQAGCCVTFATSADAACEVLSSECFDVVLVDNSVAALPAIAAKCRDRRCTLLLVGCKPNHGASVPADGQPRCVSENDIVSGVQEALEERSAVATIGCR